MARPRATPRSEAEERRHQPEDAAAPDREGDAGGKGDGAHGDVPGKIRQGLVGHVEGLGGADDAELEADDEHGEAGNDRLEDDAEAIEQPREADLDQRGEDGHAGDGWKAAGLGGKDGGAEIDGGIDRRREEAGAEEAAIPGLRRGAEGGGDEAEADEIGGDLRRRLGGAGDEDDDDQVDAEQDRVLEAERDEPREGRHVVDAIDEVGRFGGHGNSANPECCRQ